MPSGNGWRANEPRWGNRTSKQENLIRPSHAIAIGCIESWPKKYFMSSVLQPCKRELVS